MIEASLFVGPSRVKHSELCVYFRAANVESTTYPAFWTSDQREADLFVTTGESYLSDLNQHWHLRRFDKLDQLLQEIENETLKKCSQETDSEFAEQLRTRTGQPDWTRAC